MNAIRPRQPIRSVRRRELDPAQASPAPASKPAAAPRRRRWLRNAHLVIGLICTANFMVLLATGFMIQHRDAFGLERRSIGRKWLPSGYRPMDPDTEVRADIVIADLHSGRLYGRHGALVVDAATAGWLLMIATGIAIVLIRKWKGDSGVATHGNGPDA